MGADVVVSQSVSKKRSVLTTKEDDPTNKSAHITNSSASGIPTDQSFMTVIQQAGMGGSKNAETSSHFDEIITNFVSRQVRRMCHRLTTNYHQQTSNDHNGLPQLIPTATDAFAAVVMVDVSGYSKLTAALAERGPVGAELLSKTMKGYLDQIIEVIVRNGGDIVKFAGDAVIVYWKSETAINMQDSSEDIERGELVYKASHCCLELLTKLGTYDINIPDCATKTLRIHLGIGAGLVTDVMVGGAPGRWEHFIAGDGVNQLSQVLDLAKAGELALSHQALKWLVYVVDIRTLNLGDYDKRCIILTGLAKAERRVPAPEDKVEVFPMVYDKQKDDNMALYKNFMDRTALFKLQSDVNQSNLFQLDSSLSELLNLTELRQITTIFIKIGSLQGAQREELLQQSQDAIQVVQNALQRCDGSLRQFHVDDKGAVILCFFGLPPLAHENDSKLGISAGIEIREKFLDMFEEFSIGITTGVVSFGGVGHNGRAEYAVMGDAINMAARLMCHKEAKRGILCDEKTYNLCESEYQFENLGETTVKGKSNAISIFRPMFSIPETEKNDHVDNALLSSGVIGRENEKKAVAIVIEQLSSAATVDNLFFSAEGGQGLTTLANHAKAEATKQGCHFCTGKGVQIEQNNAFFIFRNIVCDLINLYDIGSKNSQGFFKLPGNSNVNVSSEEKAKLKLKIDFASDSKEGEQPPATPVSQKIAERKASRRTSTIAKEPSREKDNSIQPVLEETSQNLSPNRRQSYTVQESPVEANEEEMFTLKFKMVMDKLDCNENQVALLELVTKFHEDESDAIAQAHLRLHAKDLCDILTRMLNTLTEHNKIILMITEVQYIDSLSWDLLLELAVNCPRLSIFSFGRPESTFESKENRRIYRLIVQLPRTKSMSLNGLTAEETVTLIMCTWNGHHISGVDPKIAESIFKRTDGNPFFIRSLVMALKESGQWRVSPAGLLTTPDPNFDFDKLVLGYDNQNIVLAQFDRLDRNFQLFLKVASVLGLKFALDDVLYFLTGFADASQHIDRKKYNQIISGLQLTDKYQFLQKDSVGPDGASFQFKSALVRTCIYNMMVHNQRQQIHLLVAKYLEGKMNEQNRHRYVVQILDHYMNTSEAHKSKRIHYTEMASNYFFEKENAGETIKYCKQLLELIATAKPEEKAEISSLQIANFHRELGYALMMKDELDEAQEHLITSLKIMGHTLPPPGYKFNWALKAQISKRKKLDKTFFKDRPVPQEEDYTQSYVARKGASGYSLSNLVTAAAAVRIQGDDPKDSSGNILPKQLGVSPAQQIIRDTRESLLSATQHALVTLATVFLKKGNFDGHYYAILLGLNIATEKSIEGHMSKLFALGALALKHLKISEVSLPAQYMDAAVTYDLRIDIHTSLQQVVSNANLLFLGGQLEACQNKLEVVSYLSTMAGDLTSRVYGLHLKCLLQTHSVPRETALNTARDLYNLSFQREMQFGKIWGCYHIIHSLLGEKGADTEILAKLEELNSGWKNFPDKESINSSLSMHIAVECIGLIVPVFVRKATQPDWKASFERIQQLVSKVAFHQWHCFAGMVPLAMSIYNGLKTNEFTDPSLLKVIDLLCDTCNKSIKSIQGLQLNGPIRRLFKGLKLMAKKKSKAAMKAWQKGIEEQVEDIYTQAILHSAIALTGEDRDGSAEKAEDLIRDIKCKQRFNFLFPPE